MEAAESPSDNIDSVATAPDLNLWLGRRGLEDYAPAPRFIELARVVRRLQDVVAGSRPAGGAIESALASLLDAESALTPFEVCESEQVAARLLSDPARGQTLVPGLSVDVADREHVLGQVRFTRFHLGSNGAAHGGAVSLLFDDLLGQLANPLDGPRSRTAWIKVDFRRITPIDRELHIEARTVQRDGRKTVVRGELRDGGDLLAEAEGLFVQLRANQP